MSEYPLPFCAALIAGGKSSRMGEDKRLIEIDGTALWQRQIQILEALHPTELIISGPVNGPWAGDEYKVVPDVVSNAGPLAGLTAVLSAVTSPLVLALAVDMPRMTAVFLQSLLARCANNRGVVTVIGDRFEPLVAVYPQSCSQFASKQLSRKDNSLQRFVQVCVDEGLLTVAPASRDEEINFQNWNEPEDVRPGTEIEK